MKEKHYKEVLSAYLNHELPKEERPEIAEHLLQCADCRKEHDEIKLGASLASRLERADAPENLWNEIENALDKKRRLSLSLLSDSSFFNSRGLLAAAAALLVVTGLLTIVYFSLFRIEPPPVAKDHSPAGQTTGIELSPVKDSAQNINTSNLSNDNSNGQINANVPVNGNLQKSPGVNSNVQNSPRRNPLVPNTSPGELVIGKPSWNVETLAGVPKIGNSAARDKLTVGEVLETDANSRAKIQVANIGNVEIAPNSKVKLVKTQSTEHRLALERGTLQAKILAPPRLFIVDTPSAVAVDLGCAYTLEVDQSGNSKLHVTSGYVALERAGRESIVPAAAICFTKRGKGLGTPFFETVSPAFQKALWQLDFENGGRTPLQTIISESRPYDSLTLWHLLSRLPKTEREKVFEKLVSFIALPAGVTREGVLNLDKKMLEAWRKEMSNIWFEDVYE